MGEPLNLFPQRAAIGRADASGDVYMTPEFTRALAALMVRLGGPNGMSADDVGLEQASAGPAPLVGALMQTVFELQMELATLAPMLAMLAELQKAGGVEVPVAPVVLAQLLERAASADVGNVGGGVALAELLKRVDALESMAAGAAPPTDWEHPGKIGAAKANTGQFTSVNRVKITAPAGSATLTLGDGKTFTASNTLTLTGNDGATLNIGAGGTLGTAATANANNFAARSTTALGAAATDAATTQTLVNNIRAVLLSVGIGS